jgi:signal transduction histidine kinase
MMAGVNRFSRWVDPARWGLRARSAAAAALVVGVVLVLGAGAVLRLLDLSLVRSVEAAAAGRADTIAARLRDLGPQQLDPSLFAVDGRVTVVQILDRAGRPLRASGAAATAPLITDPLPAAGERRDAVAATGNEDLRVSARAATGPAGEMVVLVGADTQPTEDTVADVAQLLAGLGPLVVVVAALATWGLVGRSLRSVEQIRARVARIGAGDLSQRVPIPPTGDEIARLAVTMNQMLARVQAGQRAQRRFVGDASHELRSPLTTILTALEVGERHPGFLDPELLRSSLLPEGRRMRRLIEDLLLLAMADQHVLLPQRGEVDLDDITSAALSALAARLPDTVTAHAEIDPARVIGDETGLARVVANLLDNAARHAASTVTVATTVVDGWARIVVDDDGPGIPVGERARVFERFARLADDRGRDSGGAGLGLAILAEIVTAHHGRVTVGESASGGARFVVELPAVDPAPDRQPPGRGQSSMRR